MGVIPNVNKSVLIQGTEEKMQIDYIVPSQGTKNAAQKIKGTKNKHSAHRHWTDEVLS